MTLVPSQLLEVLVCPRCTGPLEVRVSESSLACPHCRLRYPVHDGIPVMLLDETTPL